MSLTQHAHGGIRSNRSRRPATRARAWRALVALAAGAVAAAVLQSPTADATFSGAPGRLAFLLDGDVYTINADGTGRRQITEGGFIARSLQWAPGGRRLLVIRTNWRGSSQAWVIRPNGTDPTQLPGFPQFLTGATWSPDGQRIFVTHFTDANLDPPALFGVYDLASQTTTPVTFDRRFQLAGGPTWSPDGRTIVFGNSRRLPDGEGFVRRLFSANIDGTGLAPIPHTWNGIGPDWSPDGTRLVFAGSGSGGNLHVFTIRPDGTDRQRLTPLRDRLACGGLCFDTAPVWAPGGRRIAFTRFEGRRVPAMWVMEADGRRAHRITPRGRGPSWQPLAPGG